MKTQKLNKYFLVLLFLIISCNNNPIEDKDNFQYLTEQFADLKMIRYKVPGFENLDLRQKKLIYFLSQASLSGRDIIFDQNYRHNLRVRRTLEAIVANYPGDRDTEDFKAFMEYTKRVWFSGGIHHHYASKKMEPKFSSEYFINELIHKTDSSDEYAFPLIDGEDKMDLARELDEIIFNQDIDSKRVNRDAGIDIILNSANNYYAANITEEEVNLFYKKNIEERAPEYGLNSKLMKGDVFMVENKKTGKKSEMLSTEYQKKYKEYTYISAGETITLTKGYEPAIHDFDIIDPVTGFNVTDKVLSMEKVLLVVCYDIEKTTIDAHQKINQLLNDTVKKSDLPIYGLSSSSVEEIQNKLSVPELWYPYFLVDQTTLKTMIRANPGVFLLEKGLVTQKWHWRNLPNDLSIIEH